MIKKKLIVLLILLCGFLYAETAYAVNPPLMPSIYVGTVVDEKKEQPVASGTINAYIQGELKGHTDFVNGEYGSLMVEGESSVVNQPVVFKVLVGVTELAAQSNPSPILWQSAKISGVDIPLIKLTVDLTKLVKKGDVNGDDVVNVRDVVMAINIALGKVISTPEQMTAADVDSNRMVNVLDVISIINLALGR